MDIHFWAQIIVSVQFIAAMLALCAVLLGALEHRVSTKQATAEPLYIPPPLSPVAVAEELSRVARCASQIVSIYPDEWRETIEIHTDTGWAVVLYCEEDVLTGVESALAPNHSWDEDAPSWKPFARLSDYEIENLAKAIRIKQQEGILPVP